MFGAPKKQSIPLRPTPETRKPFVSTAKKVTMFGEPPPLPGKKLQSPTKPQQPLLTPLPPVPLQRVEPPPQSKPAPVIVAPPPPPADKDLNLRMVHSVKYLQQSVRWLNLSTSLWSMIVVDANRVVDNSSLTNFLSAMNWRVHGDINEDEFTEVFREWMGRATVVVPHKYNCSVFVLRDLLLESQSQENDLDLLLGMVINETNRRLLHVPLSFNGDKVGAELSSKPTLELCSRRWLSLSEELFFILDAPGFGHLAFDQFYFLAACMLLAKREWLAESEAEEALSVTHISALALQLLRDAGASVSLATPAVDEQQKRNLERRKNSLLLRRKSMSMSGGNSPQKATRQGSISRRPSMSENEEREREAEEQSVLELQRKLYCGQNAAVVSLAMFKALLVARGLGEGALISLVAHVRRCCSLLAFVGRNQSSALHQTCSAYSSDGAGSPRPFHRCVYSVAGWPLPGVAGSAQSSEHFSDTVMSPILLFLLSDVEGLIPGVWFASVELESRLASETLDFNDDSSEVSDELQNQLTAQVYEAQRETRAFCDKLTEDVTKKLWLRFSNWGDSAFEPGSSNFFEVRERVPDDEAIFREPTFRFVMSVMSEYKSILLLMGAGLVDIAMDHFGDEAVRSSAAGVAAAALLPENISAVMADMTRALPRVLDTSLHKLTPDEVTLTSIPFSNFDNTNSSPVGSPSTSRKAPPSVDTELGGPGPNRIKSPMNLLFNSTADSFHTKSTSDDRLDDTSKMSVRELKKLGESGTPSADGARDEVVRMEELECNSFANWINADHEGKGSATALRMEDVEGDSFAKWVNTDDEGEAHVQKDADSAVGHSESSKMQVEIQDAVWSTVFVDEGAVGSKSPLESGNQGSTGHSNANVQDNRSAFSNITASDTTSTIEKREFLRKNKGEVSDEGSPSGVSNEDLSLMVQGQGHNTRTPLRASERRRARRKHRQVSNTQSTPPGSGGEKDPESTQGGVDTTPGQNDENEQRNQNPTVSLGVDEGSCSEGEDLEQTKKDLLATLARASDQPDGELDEQSVASNSSMANSVIELLERGQTAGLYAQSLRDLLRKMSRGDNNMHLKSLEKIIELGNSIVENEEEASQHLREQRRAPRGGALGSSPSNSRSPHTPQTQGHVSHSGSGSGRKPEAHQNMKRSQGTPRESTSSPRMEQRGHGAGRHSTPRQQQQQQPVHRGTTQRERVAERTPAPSASVSAVKKRVPGVVPAAKTRTSKQAFSL